jgi:non-ribosomal peptide synthetase component F
MKSLHELWLDVVAASPEQIMIHASEGGLSVAELEDRSSRLSARLQSHKGINALIAVPFSCDYYVALLACMKSRVTACPIDLSLPRDMLVAQMNRLSIACVIAHKDAALPALGSEIPVIVINDQGEDTSLCMSTPTPMEGSVALEDIPLLRLFTSGSTGLQSLVTIGHSSMANDILYSPGLIGIGRGDVVCCVGSHVSAMQIYSFWRCVLNGITLVPIDPKVEGISGSCARLLSVQPGVLRGHLTILVEILKACRPVGRLNNTRRLILGGEAVSTSKLRAIVDLLPSLDTITHAYSSTEALSISAFTEKVDWFLALEKVPVGHPKPGIEVSIVDDNGFPVPDGEAGEILIRSKYICSEIQGRDAHRRLEWDASKGVRSFRTGDHGRIREDGMLEHLGRVDRLIKVNGVRIDPLIVEQCIESHDSVDSCIVLAVVYTGRTIVTAAYVSPVELETEMLRSHMNAYLPVSHQPTVFLRFDSLPRTERGKPALAEIERQVCERLGIHEGGDGPPLTTTTEISLSALWEELLDTSVKRRDADFFQLGGHSLIAMRLMSRVHSTFGVHVSLPELFSDGRLDRLAARIDALLAEKQVETHAVTGSSVKAGATVSHHNPMREGTDIDYPASSFQELFWRYERGNPHAPRNPEGVMFRLHGRLDVEALRAAIAVLSRSQPALRTVFFERNGEVYQRVKSQLPIPLECVDSMEPLSESSPDLLAFMMLPFDLEEGPLFRFRLVSHGAVSHILQVSSHHIVRDASSTARLFTELSAYYNALVAGEQPVPKVRRVSLGDLAVEEREWMASEEASRSLDYWMKQLDLRGMEHGWPGQGSGEIASGMGRSVHFDTELDGILSDRIHAYLGRRGTTLFRFLLGTYCLTLQGLLPGRAVTVSVPVSLRQTEEENELIGCLISTLAVTLESIRSGTASERLRLAERRLDEAMRHGRILWYQAVDRWNRIQGVSRNIAPKTHLNFRERTSDKLDLQGLKVEHMPARQQHQPMELQFTLYGNSDRGLRENICISGSYDDARLTRAQVDLVMDSWVSVMHHCMDGGVLEVEGTVEDTKRVFAFAGGAGGFDEHGKFHRMGSMLRKGQHLQVLPDPEASFGLLPGLALHALARKFAEQIAQSDSKGKVWLLGEGLGAVDAFATACALQSSGVEEVGLILLDPVEPTTPAPAMKGSGIAFDAYEPMPERLDRLQEWIFDIHLKAAASGPLKGLTHPMPRSRRQVYIAALAYGLFDPAGYRARYGDNGGTDEELFRQYLEEGWTTGSHPCDSFHAHRYCKMADGFLPGSDEPVLHALLFGMRDIAGRRRILDAVTRPIDRSDILSARTHLRVEAFEPGMFRGDVHLLTSGNDEATASSWGRWVQGCVHRHHAADGGSLNGSAASTSEVVGRIIEGAL